MLKNYLTIALRSLTKSRLHSLINILGLSVGICCCILITLFVRDEVTFDSFHEDAARIYRVYAIEDWGENQRFINMTTPFPLGPALKSNLEEVEAMVRIHAIATQVKVGSRQSFETVTITGKEFFDIFDFPLLSSHGARVLDEQSSVVVSQSTAKRIFGDANPLSQTIGIFIGDRFEDFIVTGVVEDAPANSSVGFNMIISDLNYPKLYSESVLTSGWFTITPETYVLLQEGVTAEAVSAKFPSVLKPLLGDSYEKSKYFVGLQRLTDIHLDTSLPPGLAPVSDPKYSYILGAVALLILVVACINFVTLSIGRSLKRSREVGIRKVAGAQRSQLIIQFIGEAVCLSVIALAIGVAFASLALPLFNDLSGKQLSIGWDAFFIVVCVSLVAVIGLFAGSYPAFILSAFKPVYVLKGMVGGGEGASKQTLRKILVGVQLTLSIFLISSTILMKKQLQYLQHKNLGFDKEQLVVVPLNVQGGRNLAERVREGFRTGETLKSELSKVPAVGSVSISSHDFANGNWVNIGFTDDAGVYRTFYYNTVDEAYIETLRIELLAGRNFSADAPADKRRSIVVNESFVKAMGWEDAVGRKIPGKKFQDHDIIGVVKDFNYSSLYTSVAPLVMAMDPAVIMDGVENINIENSPAPKLLIKLKPGQTSEALVKIEQVWDKVTVGEEFDFSFVDQALARQYRSDRNLERIMTIATALALLIATLGLYGLASLAMQNRTKEISIRKVLGATRQSILLLLTKEYVVLILISLFISIPCTWFLMRDWLTTFEYRIEIGPVTFLLAGGLCLMVALIAIGFEAAKTASKQPAETLKYE